MMNFVAMCWIFSNSPLCFVLYGDYTDDAYSKEGLTRSVYISFLV